MPPHASPNAINSSGFQLDHMQPGYPWQREVRSLALAMLRGLTRRIITGEHDHAAQAMRPVAVRVANRI